MTQKTEPRWYLCVEAVPEKGRCIEYACRTPKDNDVWRGTGEYDNWMGPDWVAWRYLDPPPAEAQACDPCRKTLERLEGLIYEIERRLDNAKIVI